MVAQASEEKFTGGLIVGLTSSACDGRAVLVFTIDKGEFGDDI
jgi:hypothetical protein